VEATAPAYTYEMSQGEIPAIRRLTLESGLCLMIYFIARES
jgi:hypothetical protein